MATLPPILKLIPTRHPRRLEMLYRGHEELWGMVNGTRSDVHYLVRWGWLEKHEPVHCLDGLVAA
ncbi:MAG: hypothetical protein IPP83_08235 [Flavobacteriales bacterium]|nr:hypothetical protein [Flavobacteriales bacterium]